MSKDTGAVLLEMGGKAQETQGGLLLQCRPWVGQECLVVDEQAAFY